MKHYNLNKTQLTSFMPPSSAQVQHTFCNSFVFLHTFQYYSLANYSLKLVRRRNSIFKWKFLYKKNSFFLIFCCCCFCCCCSLLTFFLIISWYFFLHKYFIFFTDTHRNYIHMYISIFYCWCFCLLLQMWLMLFSGRMNH